MSSLLNLKHFYSVSSNQILKFCQFILQIEETTGATAVSSSPERGHPEASESSPPVKKSAMAQLFGKIFKTQVGKKAYFAAGEGRGCLIQGSGLHFAGFQPTCMVDDQ